MLHLSVALDVVLPSHEVPEEVTPIHEVHLIREEEAQVLGHGRQIPIFHDTAHPVLVGLGVALGVHAREVHVVLIQIFNVVADDLVLLFGGVCRRTIDGLTLSLLRHQILAFWFIIQFTTVGGSVEEWCVSILLTVQVTAQGEDVAWRILAHRHVGIRTDKDDTITAVACQYHQQTGQRQLEHPTPYLIIAYHEHPCQQKDVDDESGIVRTPYHVGEQQFEPTAHSHHTGYEPVENHAHKQSACCQCL